MGTPYFKFKNFTIWHDKCAMKVGTDGVLLGSWCEAGNDKSNALDIGTGSGLIAIMMAQRNPKLIIHGIDIDSNAIEQANQNIALCPYSDRITTELVDLNDYIADENKYDFIVSNPPFYEEQTYSGNGQRNLARHTSSLPFSILLQKVSFLLKEEGIFSVIIPYSVTPSFILSAAEHRLYLSRRTDVANSPLKQPKRSLLSFRKLNADTLLSKLHIRDAEGYYSTEYLSLTNDFYL